MPDITNQVEYVLKVSGANEAAAEMQTLGGAAQQAGAKSDGLSVSTVALGAALGGFAQQAARAAIDALKRLTTDAINLTVEMADLADAMTFLYEEAAPGLIGALDDLSASTGYARSKLYGISRDIGQMIVPMGVAGDKAAEMAEDLTTASADAAAALGLELSEAAGLVEQALRGSTRGARQLGIDLSEAAMNAELAAMGISGTASSVDEATKMQARYNIIMEATARYSGAAAAEMDTLEGAQRQLSTAYENMATELGDTLAPVAEVFLNLLTETMPAIQGVAELLSYLIGAALIPITPIITLVVELIDLLWDGFQQLVNAIGPPIDLFEGLAYTTKLFADAAQDAADWLRGLLGINDQTNASLKSTEEILNEVYVQQGSFKTQIQEMTMAELMYARALLTRYNTMGAMSPMIAELETQMLELQASMNTVEVRAPRETVEAGGAGNTELTAAGGARNTELTAAGGAGNTELTAEERKAQNAVKWEKELAQLNRERKRLMEEAEQARLEALQEAWDLESELLDQIAEKQNELLEQQQEQEIAKAESRAKKLVDLGEGMLNNMDRLDEFVTDMIRRWAEDLIKAFAVQTLADAFTGGLGPKILGFAGGGKSGKLLGGKGGGGFLGGR